MLNKLERDLRLPRNVAQEFVSDILGNASLLERGLVDAEDEIFTAQLHSLEDVWNKGNLMLPTKIPCSMTGS